MSEQNSGAHTPYLSVEDLGTSPRRLTLFRLSSGRLSLGRLGLALAAVIVAIPVALATVYYVFVASSVYVSESRFLVRSPIEANIPGLMLGADDAGPGGAAESVKVPGLGGIGGVSANSADQQPFMVASYIMSPEMVERLDQGGWLRARFTGAAIDLLSRLSPHASREDLFAYWRRHVAAAVDRRSLTVILQVKAYSAADAREISRRVLAASESMIVELTRRQRDDTLAVAGAELARAEARYEAAAVKLLRLRREARVVDPAREAETAGATLLGLMRERIKAGSELEALKRLGVRRAPAVTELESNLASIDQEIARSKRRLIGLAPAGTVLGAVAAFEEVELERHFAQVMLGLAANVYDRALREAEHQASFVLVFLQPTLAADPSGPRVLTAIAFVAGLAMIAWLFSITAAAIAIEQIE